MALNFPPNPLDKSIYIDPSSGLKYIFNGSVGAWETALQPPVITSTEEKPLLKLEGFLWWDHLERVLYIFKGGEWIPIMAPGGSGYLGVPVICAPEPPEIAKEGWLWWSTLEGNLYVYYIDESDGITEGTGQWVNTQANSGTGGVYNARAVPSAHPPVAPVNGELWFNTSNATLYVWDAAKGSWLPAAHGDQIVADTEAKDPLYFTKINGISTIAIHDASVHRKGVARFANYQDNSDKTKGNLMVSPVYLNNVRSALQAEIDSLREEIRKLRESNNA